MSQALRSLHGSKYQDCNNFIATAIGSAIFNEFEMLKNKSEKTVLLIWQEIPESTSLYFIPIDQLDCELEEALAEAHSHYVNEVDWDKNEGLKTLCQAVYEETEKVFDFEPGFLEKFKVNFDEPVWQCNVVRVYQSGFIL
jgi:hypothetical protein